MKFSKSVLTTLLLVIALIAAANNMRAAQNDDDKTRIQAEIVLAKINKGEKVLIIDTRTEGQYLSSNQHISDDMRLNNDAEIDTKMKDISRDRLIVTYCT
jgi:hypothetical protein